MEETPITPAAEAQEAPALSLEKQLADWARHFTEQMEASRQALENRQAGMDEREKELARRERAAQARECLRERGLPEELADCLFFADDDAVRQGVDALEAAFRAAVQQGVEERLLSSAPKTGALKPLDQLSDEEYYAAVCRND